MFGVLVTGRLVQTEFQQISETQFVFNIPDADNVNHIVVFLTGLIAFPPGTGGAVYFSWPSQDGPAWVLLGHIFNEKPSAIFKVANLKKADNGHQHPFGVIENHVSHMMQVGISIESLEVMSQQTCIQGSEASKASSFDEFCRKMLENFFNFASSFAVTQSQMVPAPSETFIPASVLQQWYTNFQRRLQQTPNFWK
ncbi:hypothetical protein HELRODRAFT_78723 [Helobdella robusta]|uniref:Uncharacterized protein n=1 Tax=Helobdella robusta TaxID=6412 RepID=T1G3F1_HELRO|nr:hypothetical protein HELRODRAFT_78723 [Helobdella robusta]ESO04809.1 hypothetical protein HELRODRAFT_78723 [Helobdella robusta]